MAAMAATVTAATAATDGATVTAAMERATDTEATESTVSAACFSLVVCLAHSSLNIHIVGASARHCPPVLCVSITNSSKGKHLSTPISVRSRAVRVNSLLFFSQSR